MKSLRVRNDEDMTKGPKLTAKRNTAWHNRTNTLPIASTNQPSSVSRNRPRFGIALRPKGTPEPIWIGQGSEALAILSSFSLALSRRLHPRVSQ